MKIYQTNAALGYRQLAFLIRLDKSANGHNYLCIGTQNINDNEMYQIGKTVEDLEESQIDDFYKMIGSNVKKIRNERGLTQLQLSQALGHKSVGLVSQSELYLKKQHFNLKHLYQLAYILDCNVEDFLQ